MTEQQVAELASLVDTLVAAGGVPNSEGFAKLGQIMAKIFAVDADEVAILGVNLKSKSLKFIIPEKLSVVGTIPLTSTNALAARTARDRKPELANNFSSSRHATVFEGVSLGRRQGELIQKIMSAPILDGAKVVGVVQISRKGQSVSSSGPDFTQKDLRTLTSLVPGLVRFLKICHTG